MMRIRKRKEPKSWAEYRLSTPHATFDDAPKEEIRRRLVEEQGYICCYCMGRILDDATTRIEHRRPRSNYKDEQFEYRNLLAACSGGEGRDVEWHHCDKHKRNNEVSVDPANPQKDIENLVCYRDASGEIDADDPQIRRDLVETLRLNLDHLKKARRSVLDGFKQGFDRKHKGDWSLEVIEREMKKWAEISPSGKLHPYTGIVVHYLRKRLARSQAARRGGV